MGCRLPKLKKAEEKRSPGNIYSTLRRPQVETKVGVSYTYHFLDFLLGKEEVSVSSVLCLSSVRELPVQVRELYAQGFVLVAVHPFVHSCGPRHAHIQRQLHRAVLVKETPSSEKSQPRWAGSRLETDVCVAGRQAADPEAIQSYVKRIQDVAEQGLVFVGFLQQPGGGPCFLGRWDPEELSSLHSSPSPIRRHPFSADASPTDPAELRGEDGGSERCDSGEAEGREGEESDLCGNRLFGDPAESHFHPSGQGERRGSGSDGWLSSPEPERHRSMKTHNNNHIRLEGYEKNKGAALPPAGTQLFALYNHTEEASTSQRFYSLRVPLQVRTEAGLVAELDADWLDHMTQHFSGGARLVDGFFNLPDDSDDGPSSVDSVFIFQSSAEENTNASYDAIVVEQWTVVDGVVVKTDYVPLLQSLAPYGWRLMCVLPTPVVKKNSDGSLSTKQILFLQRPIFQRKRKDFKVLSLRGRGKAKKNPAGEALDEHENRSLVVGAETDRLGNNTEEEEEEGEEEEDAGERRGGGGGSSKRGSLRRGLEEAGLQKSLSPLLPQRGASAEDREAEAERTPPPGRTGFCRREEGGGKEEVRMEERVRQQLFSGVC
ncbi:raftlin isoform 2-T2 [Menidia menidia]